MLKFVSVIALVASMTFTTFAETKSGWMEKHKSAHSKEQLATNKSRLDVSVIANQQQQEIMARESGDVLSSESATMIDDLLREAATHIGTRYSLGAKGPKAFDCSGFSGYVYRQFGFSIGASSRDQFKIGKTIDRKDLRKGDLVFFTSRSSGRNVGHVGIVWEVDKENGSFKFIHASTRGGVKISEFEGYYVSRYLGARRVIE